MFKKIVFTAIALALVFSSAGHAQSGMSKATAKLLVSDLIEAGLAPQIRVDNGSYIVTVSTDAAFASTAAQVNTFATNRGVSAKVLSVQFQ